MKLIQADKIYEIINPYEERGRKEGIEIGVSRGRKKGREEGREEERVKIALNMLEKGYATELIMDVTGFTTEQIEQLQRDM